MQTSSQSLPPLAGSAQAKDAATAASTSREAICARLRSAGLRSTQPRIAIYKALNDFSEPVTIEQIFKSIKATSCDLVTVYRGLALFEELGLVQRSFSNNGTGLYELKREGTPNYYVTCKQTGKRATLESEDAQELHRVLSRIEGKLSAQGFRALSHRLEFQGLSAEAPITNMPAAELDEPKANEA